LSKYSLSKSERIKSRIVVEALFSKGDSLFVHPLKLVYTPLASQGEHTNDSILFGVTVPKRIHKTAVARNRLKRLVREAYRTQKSKYLSKLITSNQGYALMFIYVHKQASSQNDINKAMERLLKKLEKTLSQ